MRVVVAPVALGLLLMSACGDAAPNVVASDQTEMSEEDAWRVVHREPVKPFPEAKTVKLFVESGRQTKDGSEILISEAGRVLTASERSAFESTLELVTYAGQVSSPACYIPHHFFRYYDEAGKEVGEVAVCFCCSQIGISDGKQLKQFQDRIMNHAKLEKLVKDMGLPTDIEC